MSDGLATKVTREEYRVWRHVLYDQATMIGWDRLWSRQPRTMEAAEGMIAEQRAIGDKSPFGIEHVTVTEESDGIAWQD